jgi:hypothetical protein
VWITATLSCMDSVRFGRALGIGARAAAKTLVTAVDAAASPNPSAAASSGPASAPSANTGVKASAPAQGKAAASGARLGQQAARTTAQVLQTSAGLKRGSRRFGEAMWGPFVKLSGVLWLELTGVFFGIFALTAAGAAWKERGGMHGTAANHEPSEPQAVGDVLLSACGYT